MFSLVPCFKSTSCVIPKRASDWKGSESPGHKDLVNQNSEDMEKLILFGMLSIPVIWISWRTLFDIRSHGFYRFVSWECILWLFVSNFRHWFEHPLSARQIFSWVFLVVSAWLVIAGAGVMRKAGKAVPERNDKKLYAFEKTAQLIDTGIFRYIRHPLYSSLLFLTWGILLKNVTMELLIISVCAALALYVTALFDEKECIAYFGESYVAYMKRSKRFIPFLM